VIPIVKRNLKSLKEKIAAQRTLRKQRNQRKQRISRKLERLGKKKDNHKETNKNFLQKRENHFM
jgi:hypothetical protein